jgi:hypothetical protein
MINDPMHGIEGFMMPDGSILQEALFADDTNLYFKGIVENMSRVCKVLDRFCQASGAKVNWAKSTAIWASEVERM